MNYKSNNKSENRLNGIDEKLAAGNTPAVFRGDEAMKQIKQIKDSAQKNDPHVSNQFVNQDNNSISTFGSTDETVEIIQQLNQEYAVIQLGNQVCILRELDINGKKSISYLKKSAFQLLLSNRKFVLMDGKKNKEVKQADFWLEHEDRRQYDGLVFEPGNNHDPRFYNFWQGFSVEPKSGNCSLYLDHIRNTICCGNEKHYQYVLSWMAHAVQKPDERPETALVLRGKQGKVYLFGISERFSGIIIYK